MTNCEDKSFFSSFFFFGNYLEKKYRFLEDSIALNLDSSLLHAINLYPRFILNPFKYFIFRTHLFLSLSLRKFEINDFKIRGWRFDPRDPLD